MSMRLLRRGPLLAAGLAATVAAAPASAGAHSVARIWNEQLISAIRNDNARPTVHARNLFHTSIAMYDAWAAYDNVADTYLHHEHATAANVVAARNEAVSFAAYRVLQARFGKSPGAATILPALTAQMVALGYDPNATGVVGPTPRALGNRIAISVLYMGLNDGSNENCNYCNLHYAPINDPLVVALPGNPGMDDPNRWQPLALNFFVDQSGNVILGGYPAALSPEWGQVTPFALMEEDLTIYNRDGFDYWVYHDPGPPPLLNGVGEDYFKWGHELVVNWSSHHTTTDGVMWDISPGGIGNAPLPSVNDWPFFYDKLGGGDWSPGWPLNPVTGLPYTPQIVPRGDYTRVLTEFWADGLQSETPPGHWYTIINYVMDQPGFEKSWGGTGPILDELKFDVRAYLTLGGALHDTAVTVWGNKGWYDTARPISAVRYMADRGQSSDPQGQSYDPDGINLIPGYIEVVTASSTVSGERHEHLAGEEGKIAIKAWRGPDYINDPETEVAEVGWILAANWWPYQRPTFVTPPFPGYTSGHSAFSRCGGEILTNITGSPYFPNGLGEFAAPQNDYLEVEEGPSVDVTLQWASYNDASDQCSLSRIWGGIHPPCDDIPSRHIGELVAPDAFEYANLHFNGQITCPWDVDGDHNVGFSDITSILIAWGSPCPGRCVYDIDGSADIGFGDLVSLLTHWGPCP